MMQTGIYCQQTNTCRQGRERLHTAVYQSGSYLQRPLNQHLLVDDNDRGANSIIPTIDGLPGIGQLANEPNHITKARHARTSKILSPLP